MDDYKFSVAMCVYNGDKAEHFDVAFKSILNQTVVPNEIVLVVDGPVNDEINKVISKYEKLNSDFRVIRLDENVGLGNALKIAVEEAHYELIARMDSDDISVSNRFENQLGVFRVNPELDVVGGNISEFIDVPENIVSYRKVPIQNEKIKHYIKKRCPFNHVSVMMKKNSVLMAGNYLDWYWNEDYYLWLRMYLNDCKFANTGTTLVNVRVGKEMYQRRGGIKYFKSEAKLQKYMLDNKIISIGRYIINITERLILQVLMPNRLRGWVFKTLARK